MQHPLFPHDQIFDFHTHSMRQPDRMEIVSIHLGKDRPHQYFTIGLHPWWTEAPLTQEQKVLLTEAMASPYCLAMGEMGLDNLKGPALDIQIEILKSQLQLAAQLRKPVVIHCVRAFDQIIQIKKEFPAIPNWCIHGYGRHGILARQLTDQGFYLSLMPGLPAAKYLDIWKAIPVDRFFLETDSMPDMTIDQIYSGFSKISGLQMPHLCRQLNSNANAFFGL